MELGDEAVELVEDEAGAEALEEGLAQRGVGLDVDALDGVDEDERRVGEARGGGDLGAEVDVAGGVDEVDPVRGGAVAVAEEHGGGLHGDGPALLLVEVVHEAEAAGEPRVEEAVAAGGDEVVRQRGLAMVYVREDARVADVSRVRRRWPVDGRLRRRHCSGTDGRAAVVVRVGLWRGKKGSGGRAFGPGSVGPGEHKLGTRVLEEYGDAKNGRNLAPTKTISLGTWIRKPDKLGSTSDAKFLKIFQYKIATWV